MPNPGAQIGAPPQPQQINAAGQFTPVFDEQGYLSANPDVASAIATGQFPSGLAHYNQIGKTEGRQANYLNQTPITDVMGNMVNNPSLPAGTVLQTQNIQEKPGEIMTGNGNKVDSLNLPTAAQATAPQQTATHTYDAQQVAGQQGVSTAAQGQVSDQAQVQAAQGQLSADTNAALDPNNVQGTVDPRSLVKNQYAELLNFGADEVPAWAKGAVLEAEGRLAARGMGSSSIASGAITAALMQAAMPIAQQDAKVFETMTLTNLDKKAQATFLKAGYLAQMDMANLNNRQAANVENAKAFLAMDMSNLNNEQQKNVLDFQSRVQTLLSDQSAMNAARQFNATSENQADQFFSNLAADVSKFNASQANDIAKFNAQIQEQRNEFNAKQQLVIDQSNATWRRQINTVDTATQNATNQYNAANLLGISNYAMSALWQQYRDEASWLFTDEQNKDNRDLQLTLAAMGRDNINSQISSNNTNTFLSSVGRVVSSVIGSWMS